MQVFPRHDSISNIRYTFCSADKNKNDTYTSKQYTVFHLSVIMDLLVSAWWAAHHVYTAAHHVHTAAHHVQQYIIHTASTAAGATPPTCICFPSPSPCSAPPSFTPPCPPPTTFFPCTPPPARRRCRMLVVRGAVAPAADIPRAARVVVLLRVGWVLPVRDRPVGALTGDTCVCVWGDMCGCTCVYV